MPLFIKFLKKRNLRSAWNIIASRHPNTPEVQKFKNDLENNLNLLRSSLKEREFRFSDYRGALLLQPGKKKPRPLKIPPVIDRVVQKALSHVIEPFFSDLNLPCSHGYISGHSPITALDQVLKLRDQGYKVVLEADIKDFFGSVDHVRLLDLIKSVLHFDDSLVELLDAAIKTQIGNPEEFSGEELLEYFPNGNVGVPQGGILSPLFANAYLSGFDHCMLSEGFKLIRYADDFVMLCKTEEEAFRAYEHANQKLQSLNLNLHPLDEGENPKTRITTFNNGFCFLGVQFNGRILTCSRKAVIKFKENIRIRTDVRENPDFIQSILNLRRSVESWAKSYSFCHAENLKVNNHEMEKIYSHVDLYVREKLIAYLRRCDFIPSKCVFENIHFYRLQIPLMKEILHHCETLENLTLKSKRREKEYRRIKRRNDKTLSGVMTSR